MDDAGAPLVDKVGSLSDLELAALLCLVAEHHAIIEADEASLDALQEELQLIAARIFGLSCSVLECSDKTTIDDFGTGLLVEDEDISYFPSATSHHPEQENVLPSLGLTESRRTTHHFSPKAPVDNRKIANVVIAKNLDRAQHQVQIQALELIRGKRIFTRTAVHSVPKRFLFIALLSSATETGLTPHLNHQFFISHYHQEEDGLPNVEELKGSPHPGDDAASISSVVRPSLGLADASPKAHAGPPLFSHGDIDELIKLVSEVRMSSEVRAYLHNIVVFLRLHRAVAGGISAFATRHFVTLAKSLAPLHGTTYVAPSLVALAARKIYPHRIVITAPENERSMQWGSSLDAVKEALEGITVEDIIEDVLQQVEVPL
ncbi:hypothetical protein K490DRAFT_69249 [Saccharata proteae CBS 121410]|uniref:magnesium chelatase n=1 Tax=Saccharata proteae CBS 121410 TaxID=1314787 RepID=A0A9P4LVD3_9PEZI|nr:hypothetical protein K490DRAFT_69249 [Saccharata proteae CBS 121410]